MIKTISYLLVTPFVMWALESVRINEIFKKSKNTYIQSRILYLMITLSLSYLVVSFIYDFLRI